MATAVLGLQWGDEGKGKITHVLARDAEMVVRFNGGPNAGHTVIDRGVKFGTHLIPAGAFYPGTVSVLAGGMVIDLEVLRREIDEITAHLGSVPELLIAENAHLILPYHRILEEVEGSGAHFGTTRRGIGPTYRDKAAHVGVRVGDLLRPEDLENRLERRLALLKRLWPNSEEIGSLTASRLRTELLGLAEPLIESVGDATAAIADALAKGKNVLFEGAQGALLDVDHGTYPYVTSSPTTFAGLGNSIGIPAPDIQRRIGIAKAYTTRVGEGPFPTEIEGALEDELRERGGEFGVTTGRPRRCGWLDLVALRHALFVNGATEIALTKLDVLTGIDEIKLCRAYLLDGERIERFPLPAEVLSRCEPVYETVPGWSTAPREAKRFEDLPAEAIEFVRRIEGETGVPAGIVSLGPAPEETIHREL
ncbi:adenylosuccinate synthase [Candidatus Bipolaricaulota bacterium]